MCNFTEAQKERLQQLSEKYRKLRARCSQYCGTWNSEDRDCEIMGSYHLSPSRCMWFLMHELRSEETK